MTDSLPDRLSVDPNSPHYSAEVLKHDIGVRFNGDDPFTVIDGSNATSPVLSGSPLFFGAIAGWFTQPGTNVPTTVNSFALDVGYLNNAGSVAVSYYDTNGQFLGYQKTFDLGIQRFIIGHPGIGGFRVQAVGQEDAGFAIDNLTPMVRRVFEIASIGDLVEIRG